MTRMIRTYLVGAFPMVLDWLRQLGKTSEQKVAGFCQNRTRQSDAQFLSDCRLSADPDVVRAALVVRRTIAKLGHIDPEFIRAEDIYPDQLGTLPMWDSIDWMAFFLELEEELDICINDEATAVFFEPYRSSGISVREMVSRVWAIISRDRPV